MRNNGNWTEARFVAFIKSALRSATHKWGPKNEVKKEARTERGVYRCVGYNRRSHLVPATLPPKTGRRRIPNIFVDHIIPVIDPKTGFTTWDSFINNLFCEKDNLQLLCKECHDAKTQEERKQSGRRKDQDS